MPIVDSPEFAGEVALEVAHKPRHMFGLRRADEEMEVIAQKRVVMKLNHRLVFV